MCSQRQSKMNLGKFWQYPADLASSQFNTMKFPRFLLALLLFLQSGRMTFYPFIRLEREAKKSTLPFLSINFPSFPFFFIFCGDLSVWYCSIKVELGQNLNIWAVNDIQLSQKISPTYYGIRMLLTLTVVRSGHSDFQSLYAANDQVTPFTG